VSSEQKLVKYYFANTRNKRFWLLITGLVFFFWVWANFRSLRRLGRLQAVEGFQFRYVNPRPIYATLVFILSLAPLFDVHAPAIYIETTQLLLMILLTFLFRKRLPRNLFYGWCIFILLFLFLPVTRILGLPVSMQRWANVTQNGLSIAFGVLFLFGAKLSGLQKLSRFFSTSKAGGTTDRPKIVFYAAGLYVFLNLLALLCNLAGRVTLSQIFGATAIYAFAQTISLVVFAQLVVEAFLLQIQTSRVRKKYPEQFDAAGVSRSIQRFAMVLSVVLWLIVFTTNLNIFDALTDLLTSVFTDPRTVQRCRHRHGESLASARITGDNPHPPSAPRTNQPRATGRRSRKGTPHAQ